MTVRCQFCNSEIDPNGSMVWRKVTGWEHKASGGSRRGGSDIALREHQEEFACGFCIDALKNGRAPSQGALL